MCHEAQGRNSLWLVQSMKDVPPAYIAAALIPALLITVLFYFDHSVSSLLAQQTRFNLRKPPTYSWDLALLGLMTAMCGLLGLPPVNGVLPQVNHAHPASPAAAPV